MQGFSLLNRLFTTAWLYPVRKAVALASEYMKRYLQFIMLISCIASLSLVTAAAYSADRGLQDDSSNVANTLAKQGQVWITTLEDEVTQRRVERIAKDLQAAEAGAASALLLKINTPGGSLEATRYLIEAILDAEIPVIGYVAPAGARASSAGTYILMATHVAAMAPATNLGSSTPIAWNLESLEGDLREKALNDAAAQLRSLAQLRDRNADWLAKSVIEAANATAEEALELGVIDLIAVNNNDLLEQTKGLTVDLLGRQYKINPGDLAEPIETDMSEFPPALVWILFGLFLCLLELAFASFVIVFFGAGAIITGVLIWFGLPSDGGTPYWVFTAASLATLFTIRFMFRDFFVGDMHEEGSSELGTVMIGQYVEYVSGFDLEKPGRGTVLYRGSHWQARSQTAQLSRVQGLRITKLESNTLWVEEVKNGS